MPINTINRSEIIVGKWEKLFYKDYHFIHQFQLAFYLGYQIITHALLFTKNHSFIHCYSQITVKLICN